MGSRNFSTPKLVRRPGNTGSHGRCWYIRHGRSQVAVGGGLSPVEALRLYMLSMGRPKKRGPSA